MNATQKEKKTIRACLFDIDGTLVPFGADAPSPETLQAIDAARAQGVKVIIATGRALFAARAVLGDAFHADYYVCGNGGLVADEKGAVIEQASFSDEEMYALVDFCEDYDIPVDFLYEDGYYVYVGYDYFLEHYGPFGASARFLHDDEDQTRHLISKPYGSSIFISEQRRAEFTEKYGYLGLRFVPFHGDHCDILRPEVNKAQTLSRLLQKLGISWAETAAFGDGGNDVEMLQMAGLAVAMGNAADSAKQAAQLLAPDAAENGAAQAVRQYVLD